MKARRRVPALAPTASRRRRRRPSAPAESREQAILDALVRCAGNQTRAAELLGIPRRTFCKKLNEHNIPRPRV